MFYTRRVLFGGEKPVSSLNYTYRSKRMRTRRMVLIVFLVVLSLLVISAIVVRKSYNDNLKPLSSSKETTVVTVEPGSAPSEIAATLKSKGVIKSDWAFEWYVRNHNLREQLKAGTYLLAPSASVPEIVQIISEGKVATDLVTILPGKNLDEIKASLIESGFSESEVNKALEPGQYADHPALTDKPKNASLEGYLYPESFQKTSDTTATQIVRLSLDEMQKRLTPEIRRALTSHGMTLHQAITLASIIEQEVSNPADKPQVAQVFLKRLQDGGRLESDATNDYAKKNPKYNTYEITGLPPGPIGNVTGETLNALAYPADTDWLYFVSGDDGKTHFSKTLEEHEALTKKYCTQLCQ